jgi:hypothetical protein
VSHALAQVLAVTGYWPPDVPFTLKDLNTTLEILAER